jgi:hypothetical protein
VFAFLRAVAILIAVALGLSLVRSFLGAIVRWFTGPDKSPGSQSAEVRSGGLLRKCPVCGTYVPESRGIKGGTAWYCSEQCRSAPRISGPEA